MTSIQSFKKSVTWKWTEEHSSVFNSDKEMLSSSTMLAHFDEEKELVMSCDSSSYGLGTVLSHKYDNGTERPIMFASRTLNVAEKNYSQIDKEALSIIFGIKKFNQYLYGRTFVIYTDHKPLITLFGETKAIPTSASGRIQ